MEFREIFWRGLNFKFDVDVIVGSEQPRSQGSFSTSRM